MSESQKQLILSRALDYFDALMAARFAGYPTMALLLVAQQFRIERNELMVAIMRRREARHAEAVA